MALSVFDTIAANLKAGLGQRQSTYRGGWAAGAGETKWDLLEKKAVLTVAAPAWTAVKGGNAPTHAGALHLKAPTSPAKLLMLKARAMSRTILTPTVRLIDVLGYANFTTTSTGLQTFTGFTLPRWTNGEGLCLYILVRSAVGAATPTATIKYTDQSGNVNQTATVALLASLAQGQIGHEEDFIELATGDRGILAVESIQLSASWLSGTAVLVLCKPLTVLELGQINRTSLNNLYGEGTPELLDSQEAYINAQYVADAAGTPKVHYGIDVCEA